MDDVSSQYFMCIKFENIKLCDCFIELYKSFHFAVVETWNLFRFSYNFVLENSEKSAADIDCNSKFRD